MSSDDMKSQPAGLASPNTQAGPPPPTASCMGFASGGPPLTFVLLVVNPNVLNTC